MLFGSTQSHLGKDRSHPAQIELFKQLAQLGLPIRTFRHGPSWME
jgi:hypothetical protein